MLNAPLDRSFKLVKAAESHVIFASAAPGEDGKVVTTSYLVKGKTTQTAPAQVKAIVEAINKHVA